MRFLRWMVASLIACAGFMPVCLHAQTPPAPAPQRWSRAKANAWYAQQPWLVGSDYIPHDAINQLAMWQAATFNPKEIDQELGWAQAIGMNTMRVFLHDLVWEQDPKGYQQRIDTFLAIAHKHHQILIG